MVAGREDYEYAARVIRERGLDRRGPLPLISPVHGQVELEHLSRWILEDRLNVRFQVQLHKYIWGADAIGV